MSPLAKKAKEAVRPGHLAGSSERARGIFFSFSFYFFLLNMKPLSVEMAHLMGIQNKIQAVWTLNLTNFRSVQG